MTTSETEPSLSADEQYQQSLTYGLIISTGLLSIVICSLRVGLLLGLVNPNSHTA